MRVFRGVMAAALALALALALTGGAAATSPPTGDLTGVVTDESGGPAAGADVIATRWPTGDRVAEACDAQGRFHLAALGPGLHHLVVYRRAGAAVSAQVIEVRAGVRLHVVVRGDHVSAPVELAPLASGGLAPVSLWPDGVPVRVRDLSGLIALLPGGGRIYGGPGGAALLGAGPGELRVTLDGFEIADPINGSAPLDLPLALFEDGGGGSEISAAAGPATEAGLAGANLRLAPRTGTRPRQAQATLLGAAGAQGRLGATRGQGGSSGDWPSPSGSAELFGASTLWDGRVRVTVAAAPGRDSRVFRRAPADSAGSTSPIEAEARGHQASVPVLARAELRHQAWRFDALGLAALSVDERAALPRIATLGDGDSAERARGGLFARAALSGANLTFTAPVGIYATASRLLSRTSGRSGVARAEAARRLQFAPGLAGHYELLGRHQGGIVLDLRLARGERDGVVPVRFKEGAASRADARVRSMALGLQDRWSPRHWIDVDLGVRLEGFTATGRTDHPAATGENDLTAGPLVAPRLALRIVHPGSGSGAVAAAGRYAWPLPLAPLLASPGIRSRSLAVPHEDVILAGVEGRLPGLALAATALQRTTGAAIEDLIGRGTGVPAFENPDGLRRTYRALILQAALRHRRVAVGAAYTLSALEGNFTGFAEPELGLLAPATTGQFDSVAAGVNRDGPLPLDRRHGLRAFGRARFRVGRNEIDAAVAARADSGTPLSALGADVQTGPGQSYVIRRGSLGRTPWITTADARVRLRRVLGSTRVGVALEVFNIGNERPVTARDEIFTPDVVSPRPGAAGASALEASSGAGGLPPERSPTFGRAIDFADPLLVRLGLSIEM